MSAFPDHGAGWVRVTRAEPCPVCHKSSWCGRSADLAIVRCMRVPSARPSGEGHIHVLADVPKQTRTTTRRIDVAIVKPEFEELARGYWEAATPDRLRAFADGLGIDVHGLVEMRAGWCGRGTWAFPQRDAERRVVGIRYRHSTSKRKWSEAGGRNAMFLSATQNGLLMLPEGATDSAALAGLGFAVAGRPDATGGTRYAARVARGRDCVVLADADDVGRRGAEALASVLLPFAATVRIVTPPAKDARAWVSGGATAADVLALVEQAPVRALRMRFVHGR